MASVSFGVPIENLKYSILEEKKGLFKKHAVIAIEAIDSEETMEDLKEFGSKDVLKLVERINKLFPDGKPSKDIDKRNEVIDSWEDGLYEDVFEKIDNKFYEIEDLLEEKLESLIKRLL